VQRVVGRVGLGAQRGDLGWGSIVHAAPRLDRFCRNGKRPAVAMAPPRA
jgi:hypothetical protein